MAILSQSAVLRPGFCWRPKAMFEKQSKLLRGLAAIGRFLPKYLYAFFVSPFLFTAGVFLRKHRFLIFQIATHFGMKMPSENQAIPAIPLASVLDQHLDQTL